VTLGKTSGICVRRTGCRRKNWPDVEMIMKIAEIFGTDTNAVLYGPPVPEEKRVVRRRVIISSVIPLAFAAAAIVRYPISMDIQRRYYIIFCGICLKCC